MDMTLKVIRIKAFVYTVCIFLTALVQSTVLEYFEVFNIKPNLMVVFIVCVALLNGNIEGAVVGFFTGFVYDALFGKMLGFYGLLGLYLGLVIGSLNKRLYRDNPFVVTFFTFVSSLAYEGLVVFFSMFNSIVSGKVDLAYILRNIILPEACYNSVVSILVFIIIAKIIEKFEEVIK